MNISTALCLKIKEPSAKNVFILFYEKCFHPFLQKTA